MPKSLSLNNRTAFDVVNIAAGLGLLLSPWYLGYAAETYAAWNAWIVGAGVAVIAAVALFAFHKTEEWVSLLLGVWAILAPWLLGFAAVSMAATVHVIAGLVVAIVAAVNLWFTTNRPYSTV